MHPTCNIYKIMGAQRTENIKGGSQVWKFLVNKMSWQFTDVWETVEHLLSYIHWYKTCRQDVILLPLLNIVPTKYCKDFFTAWCSLLVSHRHLIFEDLYLYHIQPIQHLELLYKVLQ